MDNHFFWKWSFKHSSVYGGLFVVAAIVIEVVVGIAAFRFAIMLEQNSLIGRATSIAAAMESEEITTLSGNESDLGTPLYQKLKEKIVRIKEANTDARFAYITGQRNGKVFFYMDNEPVESPDYSPPGQIYEEASQGFAMVFTRGQAIIDGPYADRWGTWVSGIAPIFNSGTGKVVAVIGIDINAVSYFKRTFIVVLASVSLVGSLLLGMFILYARYIKEQALDRAKSEFVSLASHQLKTPLTTISWYAEMLLNGRVGKVAEKQKEYLEKIFHNNRRMKELVNALLNTSRIELGTLAIEPKPVNLIAVADSVLDELSAQINSKRLQIERDYEKNLPIINADPQLTRIIFQNLLSNSVKYTPDRGIISLTIKTQQSDILIKVSDSGYGIPKAQQSQIFKKLFRADNVREKEPDGTGLGLYIVKSVIEQFGGKILFESKENKGTIFYVTVPLRGMEKKKGTKGLV